MNWFDADLGAIVSRLFRFGISPGVEAIEDDPASMHQLEYNDAVY